MKGTYTWKPYKDAKLKALALWLIAHQINANLITIIGLLFGLAAAGCVLLGRHWLGLTLLSVSLMADLSDGTVARLVKTNQISGKILDSVCDRLVETAWVGALIGIGWIGIWALFLVMGSIILMFCRLWAYGRKIDSSFVMVARFERMAALTLIILLPWRVVAQGIFILITIGTYISSLQIAYRILKSKSGTKLVKPGA